MQKGALTAHGVRVSLGAAEVLRGIDLSLPAGSWTSVVGPNGAGKSTLLKALAHLVPYTGEVHLSGRRMADLSPRKRGRQLAWLGQGEMPNAAMRVQDLVMLGRLPHQGWLARPTAGDQAAVETALRMVGAWDLRGRSLHQLSGGERQRVLLARALAVQADVLLMDEPLNNLDPPHQTDWLESVLGLVRQGKTVVSVLHEVSFALQAQNMVIMAQGRVVYQGPCGEAATHRALEAVFEHRIAVHSLHGQWIAVPRLNADQG